MSIISSNKCLKKKGWKVVVNQLFFHFSVNQIVNTHVNILPSLRNTPVYAYCWTCEFIVISIEFIYNWTHFVRHLMYIEPHFTFHIDSRNKLESTHIISDYAILKVKTYLTNNKTMRKEGEYTHRLKDHIVTGTLSNRLERRPSVPSAAEQMCVSVKSALNTV